ncbi:tellurite resistance/C4-dicarboxylate transporter family protein [Nocardia cyriacigeorgica]|nr:tellurite resistance/C4-dicarboxylate transporter family protein [Nocardia cyriacigeorgica]MBF6199374.1 tellurite resistance/C4-dicarboxylate transporter family protein [Nocardia cyriacigeorgica]MBF6515892.1 tellurite resistance/C4-dicarboxylate transporter family protein [Nocardia cyriacigeorgica]
MTAMVEVRTSPIENLKPAWFASVMATGIVSRAVGSAGLDTVSAIMLYLALVAFAILVVATLVRLVKYRTAAVADAMNPATGFTYLTFVAAAAVMSTGLSRRDHLVAALTLLAVAALAWLILGYGIPALLMVHHRGPAGLSADGTWFIWVVATQSLAVAATALPQPWAGRFAVPALLCWSVGTMLYLLVATLVLATLFTDNLTAARLVPAYWVFMGATAISVLAAAQLLHLDDIHLLTSVRPVLIGVAVLLWAFGSWLIPLLLVAGVWRHFVQHIRLAYEPGLWSIVFPIGMYGVGTRELGSAIGEQWMVTFGGGEAWVALTVWIVTAVALLLSFRKSRDVSR